MLGRWKGGASCGGEAVWEKWEFSPVGDVVGLSSRPVVGFYLGSELGVDLGSSFSSHGFPLPCQDQEEQEEET